MTLRKAALLALSAVIVAGGAVTAYWFWSAERLSRWIAAWTEQQRARGYQIAYDGPVIEGFPTRLVARFDAPQVVSPRGWHWRGPAVSGHAMLWTPAIVHLDFSGRHRVAPAGAGPEGAAELDAREAKALVHLRDDGEVEHARVLGQGLVLRGARGVLTAEQARATLGPVRPAQADRQQHMALAGELVGVKLPRKHAGPLGPDLRRLDFDGALVGTIPPGDQRRMLEQWRDAGGKLDVAQLRLAWGPLGLDGGGSFTLDPQLRPLGRFKARVRGLSETIDVLVARDLIPADKAASVKLAAFALAGRLDEDGETVVVLPVNLRDGLLYLGPVPLFPIFPVL